MVKTEKLVFKSVCSILFCICLCESHNITLNEGQKQNGTSTCTRGILSDYDKIRMTAMLDFKDFNNMSSINLRYRKKYGSDFTSLCHYYLNDPTKRNPDTCTFTFFSKVDKNVKQLDISFKANQVLSGATLRGVVTHNNDQFSSNDVMLPEIYNIRSSTLHLLINGEKIDHLKDIINIIGPNLTISAVCECEAAPCWIEISTNDSAEVEPEKQFLFYKQTFEKSTTISVTIKHAPCRLDAEYNTMEFRVKIDIGKTSGHLIFNGREISTEQLEQPLSSGPHMIITFICKSQADPKSIEICTKDSPCSVGENNFAVFERVYETSQEMKVTIKHACNFNRENNIIELRTKIDVSDDSNAEIISALGGLLTLFFLLTIFCLIIIVLLVRKFKIKCFQPKGQLACKKEPAHCKTSYQKKVEKETLSSPDRDTSNQESLSRIIKQRDINAALLENTENESDVMINPHQH